MAVSVRLQRRGKTHKPFYHIVAADHHKARDGRFIEKLGYYDPNNEPSTVVFKEDRIQHWYGHGAVLSPAVKTMMKKHKVKLERNKKSNDAKK